MKKRFEVLPGLPPYGPVAKPFPQEGPHYREGFAVRFFSLDGTAWVGNFQPGCAGCNTVLELGGETHCLVVSNGAGYIVESDSGALVAEIGNSYIHTVLAVPELQCVLVGDACAFQALGRDGQVIWKSEAIACDGMRNIAKDGIVLSGEAWGLNERWYPFQLNLKTGALSGGAYHPCHGERGCGEHTGS
jgi:hypothetical protein